MKAMPVEYQLAASASRTANPTLQPALWRADPCAAGLAVIVDITNAGTGSINVLVQGWDPGQGDWYTILDSGALTTVQEKVLVVHPNVTDTANAKAGQPLPLRFRVVVNHNNANAIIYSVGAIVLPY